MTRRDDLLDELAELRDGGPTPRIDTTRNRIDALASALSTLDQELIVLHVLAYDRAAARRETTVAGGTRDYALDTHGDPRARAAYRQIALAALDACDILTLAAKAVTAVMRTGEHDHTKTRQLVDSEELALALEARAARAARGEFDPAPAGQPSAALTEKVLQRVIAERDALQRKVERLERQLPAWREPSRRRGWQRAR